MTGHRRFDDPDAVVARVDAALDAAAGDPPAPLEVWSSLAEGADRLVASRVLARPDATLVAVLPLEPNDYRTDFSSPASLAEFDELLGVAARVEVTGPDGGGDRESAYERAGLRVVDRCDVLLALWDGGPSRGRGGTAEIVDAARERGRDVVVIGVTRRAR